MKKIVLIAAAIATFLSGCATYDLQGRTPAEHVEKGRNEAVRDFAARPSVREIDSPYLDLKLVKAKKPSGPLTVRAASTAFGPLLSETARANGYSVVFADSVDVDRRVSVELNGVEVIEGLRTLAYLAGYVGVIDADAHTLTVAESATFTYKVPPNVLQQLQASYKVGGNPVSNGAPGEGGASGGGGGASSMAAEFLVSGQAAVNATSVRTLITNLAGRNANVMISDSGLITVTANAQAQRRVHSFLKSYVHDALSQVEIEASIVEVSLNDEFEFGIDWGKIMEKGISGSTGSLVMGAVGSAVQGLSGGLAGLPSDVPGTQVLPSVPTAPTLTAAFTTHRIGAVVNALRRVTDAKVVSNPHILAVNNSPATFFDGTQLPYLGSVTATPTTSGGANAAAQLSGSASYAVDGISFSVQPSIIDENRVQITLVPVLSSVSSFEKLELGNGQGVLTAPRQTNKQSFMKVVAENGKTLILGGIRYSVDQKSETPAPVLLGSRSRNKTAKEIVILMRATVLPAKDFDPLIGESI